jgi:pimeloyl-ACP methyl ester carboxylesterase
VDWCGLSSDGAYIFSSFSTATTADRVADMLLYLTQNGYIKSPKDIRITGHSLGGHTAGITGKKFNNKFGQKVARVDAIDPAGKLVNFLLKSQNVYKCIFILFRPQF